MGGTVRNGEEFGICPIRSQAKICNSDEEDMTGLDEQYVVRIGVSMHDSYTEEIH